MNEQRKNEMNFTWKWYKSDIIYIEVYEVRLHHMYINLNSLLFLFCFPNIAYSPGLGLFGSNIILFVEG